MSVHPAPDATPPGAPLLVDLGQVLLRVAGSARAVARARRVLLSVEVESGPLAVPGAAGAMHDAVLDVVGHAVSTCHPGALVVLDVHAEDGGVAVDVTDTGPGVPSTRADTPAARTTVEAHGGRLTIASVEGVGTAVHMWWPVHGAPAAGRRLAAV